MYEKDINQKTGHQTFVFLKEGTKEYKSMAMATKTTIKEVY